MRCLLSLACSNELAVSHCPGSQVPALLGRVGLWRLPQPGSAPKVPAWLRNGIGAHWQRQRNRNGGLNAPVGGWGCALVTDPGSQEISLVDVSPGQPTEASPKVRLPAYRSDAVRRQPRLYGGAV